jgi:hypothetical protein
VLPVVVAGQEGLDLGDVEDRFDGRKLIGGDALQRRDDVLRIDANSKSAVAVQEAPLESFLAGRDDGGVDLVVSRTGGLHLIVSRPVRAFASGRWCGMCWPNTVVAKPADPPAGCGDQDAAPSFCWAATSARTLSMSSAFACSISCSN